MKIVLVPGWHEKSKYLAPFIDGRHGIPGFRGRGFTCATLPDRTYGGMRAQVDAFAEFVEQLHDSEPESFPIGTFGYSAGGVTTRAYLRAYPHRAAWVAGTFQLAAPNAGLVANFAIPFLRALKMPADMLRDLDVAADFMTWLNDTTGHWEPSKYRGYKRWVLDKEPWLVPEGHPVFLVAGSSQKHGPPSDGVVELDWATLNDRVPTQLIEGHTANHLNLGAAFDGVAFFTRGWHIDDVIWPQVIETATTFFHDARARHAERYGS